MKVILGIENWIFVRVWMCDHWWIDEFVNIYVILGIEHCIFCMIMNIVELRNLWIFVNIWNCEYANSSELIILCTLVNMWVLVKLILRIEGYIFMGMWILMYIWILYNGEMFECRITIGKTSFKNWI